MAGRRPGDEPSYDEPQRGRTIWGQISMATKMAVGAREVAVDDKKGYLHFRVTKKHGDFRKIVVQLTPMDTYDVKLVKMKRGTYEPITEYEATDIYAESLSEIIYDMVHDTGSYRPTKETNTSSSASLTMVERDFERGLKDADMGIAHPGTIPNDGPEYAERLNAYLRGVEKWEHKHGGVKTWQRDKDQSTRRVPQSSSNQPVKDTPSRNPTLRDFATHQEAKDYVVRASSSDHKKIMQDVHEGSIDEALWAAHRQGNIVIREPRKRSRKELKARQSSLESRIRQHRDHIKGRRTYEGRSMTEDEMRSWKTNLVNMEKEFLLNDHELKSKGGV